MAEQGMSNAPPPGPQVEEGVGGEGLEEEELYEVNEAGEMLLENSWVFFFDEGPPKGTQLKSYQAVQKTLGTFTSVQEFWRYWDHMGDIMSFPEYSNLRMFKAGIQPTWEDPANERGGKYVISTGKVATPRVWSDIVLCLIGEQFDDGDDICGVVLSIRPKGNTINIWNSTSDDPSLHASMVPQIQEVIAPYASEGVSVEYKIHQSALEFVKNYKGQQHHNKGRSGRNRRGGRNRSRGQNQGPGFSPQPSPQPSPAPSPAPSPRGIRAAAAAAANAAVVALNATPRSADMASRSSQEDHSAAVAAAAAAAVSALASQQQAQQSSDGPPSPGGIHLQQRRQQLSPPASPLPMADALSDRGSLGTSPSSRPPPSPQASSPPSQQQHHHQQQQQQQQQHAPHHTPLPHPHPAAQQLQEAVAGSPSQVGLNPYAGGPYPVDPYTGVPISPSHPSYMNAAAAAAAAAAVYGYNPQAPPPNHPAYNAWMQAQMAGQGMMSPQGIPMPGQLSTTTQPGVDVESGGPRKRRRRARGRRNRKRKGRGGADDDDGEGDGDGDGDGDGMDDGEGDGDGVDDSTAGENQDGKQAGGEFSPSTEVPSVVLDAPSPEPVRAAAMGPDAVAAAAAVANATIAAVMNGAAASPGGIAGQPGALNTVVPTLQLGPRSPSANGSHNGSVGGAGRVPPSPRGSEIALEALSLNASGQTPTRRRSSSQPQPYRPVASGVMPLPSPRARQHGLSPAPSPRTRPGPSPMPSPRSGAGSRSSSARRLRAEVLFNIRDSMGNSATPPAFKPPASIISSALRSPRSPRSHHGGTVGGGAGGAANGSRHRRTHSYTHGQNLPAPTGAALQDLLTLPVPGGPSHQNQNAAAAAAAASTALANGGNGSSAGNGGGLGLASSGILGGVPVNDTRSTGGSSVGSIGDRPAPRRGHSRSASFSSTTAVGPRYGSESPRVFHTPRSNATDGSGSGAVDDDGNHGLSSVAQAAAQAAAHAAHAALVASGGAGTGGGSGFSPLPTWEEDPRPPGRFYGRDPDYARERVYIRPQHFSRAYPADDSLPAFRRPPLPRMMPRRLSVAEPPVGASHGASTSAPNSPSANNKAPGSPTTNNSQPATVSSPVGSGSLFSNTSPVVTPGSPSKKRAPTSPLAQTRSDGSRSNDGTS